MAAADNGGEENIASCRLDETVPKPDCGPAG